jgi:hypothetical protein
MFFKRTFFHSFRVSIRGFDALLREKPSSPVMLTRWSSNSKMLVTTYMTTQVKTQMTVIYTIRM